MTVEALESGGKTPCAAPVTVVHGLRTYGKCVGLACACVPPGRGACCMLHEHEHEHGHGHEPQSSEAGEAKSRRGNHLQLVFGPWI